MNQVNCFGYDDLAVGQTATYSKTLTEKDIALYGVTSGDINPVHFCSDYAATTPFKNRIGHGMWSAGLLSACIGMKLPGPGSIYLRQDLQFRNPVYIGDQLTATLTVKEKLAEKKWIVLDCLVINQDGKKILMGDATVMPPKESGVVTVAPAPNIDLVA